MSKRQLPQQIELQIYDTEPLSRSYLEDDTKDDPTKPFLERQSSFTRFSGWRGGVLISIVACAFVLLLNVILAIVSGTAWKLEDNIATAFTGNCKTAANWTTALHLLINLLSSLLLGASNYCMQRLVAPTRKEVDDAHAKNQWLDIGVPSIRNLPRIDKKRALLWLLLGLSSVPLHLFYNSVVFETIAANEVNLLIVTEDFFQEGAKWVRPSSVDVVDQSNDTYISDLQKTTVNGQIYDSSAFEYLEGAACKDRYQAQFITTAGTGFVVFDFEGRSMFGLNESRSFFDYYSGYGGLGSNLYEPYYDYCYSQVIEQKCQVQFSLTILAIVIACNAVKLILMCIILWRLNHETIVTIGDAIKCFLRNPDPTTRDCCLMSRRTINKFWKHTDLRMSQRWEPRHREPWSGACSTRRWCISILLYAAALGSSGALLAIATSESSSKNSFGKVSGSHMIHMRLPNYNSIIPYALIANSPQAIISFLYLTYNGLFTCMLANREWSNYAVKRAPLRVTHPESGQRSTYFLQLPYFWSVPLLLASVILHWFISQSIFLARIALYSGGAPAPVEQVMNMETYKNFEITGSVFSGVGFSDTALQGSIGWGATLVGVSIIVGFIFTYPRGLPVGGTNSAVISAACHVKYRSGRQADEGVPNRALQWGVTIAGSRERDVGHCCFSDCEVEPPKIGHLYAGVKKKND